MLQSLTIAHVGKHLHSALEAVGAFPTVQKKYNEPAQKLDVGIFSVPPPSGTHVLVATLQVIDDDTVIIAFEGRTYQYRARLYLAGIPLVTDTNTRLLPEGKGDISDPTNRDYIVKVFEEHVFRKLAVCLRVTGESR